MAESVNKDYIQQSQVQTVQLEKYKLIIAFYKMSQINFVIYLQNFIFVDVLAAQICICVSTQDYKVVISAFLVEFLPSAFKNI